jgi:RimJ/RimL family protein N-acetyltransferase
MSLEIREMRPDEVDHIIDYFHRAGPEHLELMGVDPTRLPQRAEWRTRLVAALALRVEERPVFPVAWLEDDRCIGFSTADKIIYGEQAHMHLHIIEPDRRAGGLGALCVARTARLYFDRLRLERLFSEPNAFNIAPNRALQKAGFRYVKTHMTVPGPLNYHQAVTRWVIERTDL